MPLKTRVCSVRTKVAACAGSVVDDDGLAEKLAEFLAYGACVDVGGRGGGKRHYQADRLGRIRLRGHPATERGQRGRGCEYEEASSLHDGSPSEFEPVNQE